MQPYSKSLKSVLPMACGHLQKSLKKVYVHEDFPDLAPNFPEEDRFTVRNVGRISIIFFDRSIRLIFVSYLPKFHFVPFVWYNCNFALLPQLDLLFSETQKMKDKKKKPPSSKSCRVNKISDYLQVFIIDAYHTWRLLWKHCTH